MTGTFPDVWSETALVAISPKGGSDVDFVTVIETIDIDQGDKPVEFRTNIKGGRVAVLNPQEPINITFEAFPVSISSDTTQGGPSFSQYFQDPDNLDTSQPLQTTSSLNREKFRVAILWTDGTASDATSATSTDETAYRYVVTDAYLVSAKPAFTDGIVMWTVEFSAPPFNKSGTANVTEQSTDGTSTEELAALGSYT